MTVKAALFEDSAALVGLRWPRLGWPCGRSPARRSGTAGPPSPSACLLVVVAIKLGLDSRDFLIGRAADPETWS